MHRKGFISVVILFGALFYTQISCKYPLGLISMVQLLTNTPFPPLRIHFTPRIIPPPSTQIRPQPDEKVFSQNPLVSDQKKNVTFEPFQDKISTESPMSKISPEIEDIPKIVTPTFIAPTITKTHPMPSPTFSPTPPPPSQTPFPFFGKLLISKVMYNPIGDEPENEWIELYNPDNVTTEISNFKVGDEETPNQSEGMLIFPQNSFIQPQQVIVIANHATVFYNRYGRYPSYEINESEEDIPNMTKYSRWSKGNVSLNNENDEVLLLDGADLIIDMVSWSNDPIAETLPVFKEGSAIERMPAREDTNTRLDWVEESAPMPFFVELNPPTPSPIPVSVKKTAAATKTSTPTATLTPSPTLTETPTVTSTSPPTPNPYGRLVISEVMFNLSPPNPYGVWVEIFNQETFPVDLTNYHLGDEEELDIGGEGMYIFPEGAVIQPRSIIVVAYTSVFFETAYNYQPDYEILPTDESVPDMHLDEDYYPIIAPMMDLSCVGDEVLLLYIDHMPKDVVIWGNSRYSLNLLPQSSFDGSPVPVPLPGCSIERINKDADSNTKEDWQIQCNPSPGN